ncbi:hypothetical protein HT031_002916 [Scenedesmus sp. PABB004]|nr:hypothetical protein HT031_002916 [Scenedesmus sp. PABB004]
MAGGPDGDSLGRFGLSATPGLRALLAGVARTEASPPELRRLCAEHADAEVLPWKLVQRAVEEARRGGGPDVPPVPPAPELCAGARLALPRPPARRPRSAALSARLDALQAALDRRAYDAMVADVAAPEQAAAAAAAGDPLLPTTRLQVAFGVHVLVTMGAFFALGHYAGRILGGSDAWAAGLGAGGIAVALVLETALLVLRSNMPETLDRKYAHLLDKQQWQQQGARQQGPQQQAQGPQQGQQPRPAGGGGGAARGKGRRVVVTGVGAVTPLGVGAAASWERLLAGATGVRALQADDLPEAHRAHMAQLPCQVVAGVPREQVAAAVEAAGIDLRRSSPFMVYAQLAAAEARRAAAARPRRARAQAAPRSAAAADAARAAPAPAAQALRDAGWAPTTPAERAATGVAIGAGMSCTAEIAEAGALVAAGRLRRLSPFFVPRILVNSAAGAVGIAARLRGPNHAASTACATGGHALGDAFRLVQRGDADAMLAGATEGCIDALSLAGFCRLKALSTGFNADPRAASRPFDARRDGFVMGEGAGVLLLEELGAAARRGARVYAEVRGYGLSGDGHHITAPHPDGAGAALAMQRAMQGSGVPLEAVAHINAHATSTPVGDEIEQAAILSVFGPERVRGIAVSSTKGATGHLLGAAGAVEAVFSVLALAARRAPATANLESPSPALLPRLVAGAPAALPPGPAAVLCNSFGFGGTNASVLFATPPAA